MAYSPEPFDEVLCFDLDNHRNLADCVMVSSFLLANGCNWEKPASRRKGKLQQMGGGLSNAMVLE